MPHTDFVGDVAASRIDGYRPASRRSSALASVAILHCPEPRASQPWAVIAARDGFSPTGARFFTRNGADAFADAYMAPGGTLVAALRAGDGADLLAMRAQGVDLDASAEPLPCSVCGSLASPCECAS